MMDVWRPIEDYRAVNVTGTENIGRAALAAGVRRFVHMSSSSVYGVALGRPADESFPLAPFPDPYPITKAEGDRLVQRMIAEDHLPAVIIRPDQIFGPGDHLHFGAMADRLRSGRGIVVGSGDNAMPFVYVTDIVRGLLLALDHDHAVGQAYNITNDHPLTQKQLLQAIAHEMGASPPRWPYPLPRPLRGWVPGRAPGRRRRRPGAARPSPAWASRSSAPTTGTRSVRPGASSATPRRSTCAKGSGWPPGGTSSKIAPAVTEAPATDNAAEQVAI